MLDFMYLVIEILVSGICLLLLAFFAAFAKIYIIDLLRSKKRKTTVYIDKVDYDYELEEVDYGTTVYPNLEEMRKHHPCVDSCGVVKCTIVEEEVVIPENWSKSKMTTVTVADIKKLDPQKSRLKGAQAHLKYLKQKVARQEKQVEKIEQLIKENNNGK